ncbi:MAG: phosphoadenosine phosphosulfate reductase family protein, partial [Thermaurantiacus sp.]
MTPAAARADMRSAFGPADAEALSGRFQGVPTARLLETVVADPRFGAIAVVSSFGAESAVLLHLVAQIDRGIPVILLETGKLFAETLA